MKWKSVAVIISSMLWLGGCTSVGTKFDTTRVSDIKKGQTTRQEIIAMFGEPASRSFDPDGGETLTYSFLKGGMSASSYIPVVGMFTGKVKAEHQSLTVMLKDKVVQNFTYTEGKQ